MYNPSNPLRSSLQRQSNSSSRSCRRRNFFCCFCTIFTILVIMVTAALIIKLIVQPQNGKVHITEATLTQFNLTTTTILYYNLSLTIQFRNPNKHMSIDYKSIIITADYKKHKFSNSTLAPFHQDCKTTTFFETVFEGQSRMLLEGSELSQYKSEEISGVYTIDVNIELKVKSNAGNLYVRLDEPKVFCDLKIPLNSGGNNGSNDQFQDTKCRWDSRKYDDYY